MSLLARSIRSVIKSTSLKLGLFKPLFFDVYPYMYEPGALMRLTQLVSEVREVPGVFIEAGCAYGATTVFLNKFMSGEELDRKYYALDTFSGFVDDQLEHEIRFRGKPEILRNSFTHNKKIWFDETLSLHKISRVQSIQVDVAQFDFAKIAPIAFCLLDVDLYKPIKKALPRIYEAMSPGGIIVVDDCKPRELWDGALQAYEEFTASNGLPEEIVENKLGIIRVGPAHHDPTNATKDYTALKVRASSV